VIIGILLVPYLVKHLGISAYGLIPLAMFVTEYIGLITQSITSSINRYITLAIHHGDVRDANVVFNTSLFLMISIALLQLLFFTYPMSKIDMFLSIPSELIYDAKYLFILTFFNFLISMISSVFSVSMYSKNRLDLIQIIEIIRVIIRTVLIVALFYSGYENLRIVGFASILSGCIVLFMTIYQFRKLTPYLSINPFLFRWSKVSSLTKLGGWLLINQIGFLLFSKVDLILINKYIGAEESGEYAAVMQISNLIRNVMGVLSGVMGPIILVYYAKKEWGKLKGNTLFFMKVLSFISVIPISILSVYSTEILFYWLGGQYVNLNYLLIILILPLAINIGVMPLFSINTAYNKVKVPGVISCVLGITSVLLSYIFLINTDFGYYAVAIIGVCMLTIKNAIFTPIYTAVVMDLKWNSFLIVQIYTISFLIIILAQTFFIKMYFDMQSVIEFIIAMIISGLAGLLSMCLIFYFQDKRHITSLMKGE